MASKRPVNRLSALQVQRARKPGRYADGGGLYLQIAPNGTKSWVLRYMRQGRERFMGLGPVSLVSLADARERALAQRKLLLAGVDPIEAKRSEQAAIARRITFREAAERFIAAKESGWRNEKHQGQWGSTLERYAYPVIGDLAVADLAVSDVLGVVEPHWDSRRETMRRVRGRIEQVIASSIARGERTTANPADWKQLQHLLAGGRKAVRHHPALAYTEAPAFMRELRERQGVSARALEFTILTACRTGEVIGATWSEIDLTERVWTVPASRMKAGKEHRVPLSNRAIQVLQSLPREDSNSHVFIGGKRGAPLSNMAMLELLKGMRPGYVPHGFRSTFRDWAAERTPFPNHVVEMALAHVVDDKVEAAYRRGDLLQKRRHLMEAWAGYCTSKPKIAVDNVVEMREAARS